ncbi:hypothetical protein LSM04_003178 [Trypanosoma melophagium]|uniref:uncharacterized protein n=1 Tax=Trypanosoma melophagium TaxID=715481 RepID=UPI00351A8F15|nr:hypothetical protein LSM04_003178 [Trypanosoma melophagium]
MGLPIHLQVVLRTNLCEVLVVDIDDDDVVAVVDVVVDAETDLLVEVVQVEDEFDVSPVHLLNLCIDFLHYFEVAQSRCGVS